MKGRSTDHLDYQSLLKEESSTHILYHPKDTFGKKRKHPHITKKGKKKKPGPNVL